MGEYRSKSYGDGRMEKESYYSESHANNGYGKPSYETSNNGVNFQDLRCYSPSYATSTAVQQQQAGGGSRELKKAKSSASSRTAWCFVHPDMQRKKRVASYKSYSVEGKVKRSFSKSFRWLKDRYTHMVNGW